MLAGEDSRESEVKQAQWDFRFSIADFQFVEAGHFPFPCGEFVGRKWLEEFRTNAQFPLERAGPAATARGAYSDETSHWDLATHNDDFFTLASPLDQL